MITLYVGNLSFQATDEDVRSAFAPFGEVAAVKVARDRETGRAHGFALVEMPDAASAQRAIAGSARQPIAGRPVRVTDARPRAEPDSR